MPAYLRILSLTSLLLFVACGNNADEQVAPPTTTTPVATTATAPEVPQSKEEVTVASPSAATAPSPPVTNAATPDRDATRTEDKPVIEGRDSPAVPSNIAVSQTPTTPASAPSPTPVPVPVPAPSTQPEPQATEVPIRIGVKAVDHKAWDAILQQYVTAQGLVDYAGLKKTEAKLDAYLTILQENTPAELWSHNERLAYWINAYNAFTFKLILDNYPVGSITDLDGGDPWKVKWINLGDKTYSLNNIEHDIIRPRFKDPRIHFAVVCAAKSCPPLLNKAFEPENLNLQLDLVTRKFIGNSKFNQVNGDVRISKIFDWYAEDFGDVRTYINRYSGRKIPAGKEIGFMDYDWSLNKQ